MSDRDPRGDDPRCAGCGTGPKHDANGWGRSVRWCESENANYCRQCRPWPDHTPAAELPAEAKLCSEVLANPPADADAATNRIAGDPKDVQLDDARELALTLFDSSAELKPPLLEHCRRIVARFRPGLTETDIVRLVDSEVRTLERDAGALKALRALGTALTFVDEEASAPLELPGRSSVFRASHADAMRAILPEVRSLTSALVRELRKTVFIERGSDSPMTVDDPRLWKQLKLCRHEAIISRFSFEGPADRAEPWEAGPPATSEFLAAVSFLSGTEPVFQKHLRTIKAVMDREVAAINMWVTRLDRRSKVRKAR
jgi:hypothetical protein